MNKRTLFREEVDTPALVNKNRYTVISVTVKLFACSGYKEWNFIFLPVGPGIFYSSALLIERLLHLVFKCVFQMF